MNDRLTEEEINEYIDLHSESYIESYEGWQEVVTTVNELIRNTFNLQGDYFTYNSFCVEFNKAIKYYLLNDEICVNDEFAEDKILEIMIIHTGERIINSRES